jgi:hypothetical protein
LLLEQHGHRWRLRLNALRSQVRKRLTAFVGADRAEEAADVYVRMVRIHFDYHPLPKQIESTALISSLTGQRIEAAPHRDSGGAAGASVPRPKALGGVWGRSPHEEPTEYDAAHAREEGDAA